MSQSVVVKFSCLKNGLKSEKTLIYLVAMMKSKFYAVLQTLEGAVFERFEKRGLQFSENVEKHACHTVARNPAGNSGLALYIRAYLCWIVNKYFDQKKVQFKPKLFHHQEWSLSGSTYSIQAKILCTGKLQILLKCITHFWKF